MIAARCAEWGDDFDQWQADAGSVALGKRADGYYAATIGGITFSIPRQVAKTFLVMRIVFALCTLFPNLTVIWTAHRQRTATSTFNKLKGLASRKAAKPYIESIRSANGEQEIAFKNGSRIMFGAREQGFGRGFDEVDVLVFDEAQILTEKALEDMVAATNQSRFEAGALLFYMGTPPRPIDPGDVFTQRRTEALALKDGVEDFGPPAVGQDAVYIECSADANVGKPGGPGLDDWAQVEKANPSYPLRTPKVSIQRLRKNLSSDDGWRREGLGVWDDLTANGEPGIDPAKWATLADPESRREGMFAIGLDMAPNRSEVDIALIGRRGDGKHHGQLLDSRPGDGSSWVVERLSEIVSRGDVITVVIDPLSAAANLIPDLRRAGVNVSTAQFGEYVTAVGQLRDLVDASLIAHLGQDPLDAAVAGAFAKQQSRGGAKWMPRGEVSISPLVALTLALHGFEVASTRAPINNIW